MMAFAVASPERYSSFDALPKAARWSKSVRSARKLLPSPNAWPRVILVPSGSVTSSWLYAPETMAFARLPSIAAFGPTRSSRRDMRTSPSQFVLTSSRMLS